MLDQLQFRSVARDLPLEDAPQEDNLLIEAVSLLVQRQRETESWVLEQVEQAEARAAAVEHQYAELEGRLAGIEFQLDRLARELEPGRGDAAAGQRLARLREQVEDLKSDTDGRPLRPVPAAPAARSVEAEAPSRTAEPESPTRSQAPISAAANSSLWEFFGPTPTHRLGTLFMFLGTAAFLYAILSQLRF